MQPKEQPNILIVDDRPENLLALKAILDGLGYDIIEAESGKDALKLLLQNEVALVLLDVNMPVMDGFETARLIRQRKPAALLPILFISARDPSEADRRQGFSLGAIDYITKPVVPEILRAKVSALLDLQRRASLLETAVQERTAELQNLNERAVELRETISELEAFSYTVSHDMRGPLRSIQSYAQLLKDDHGQKIPDDGRELLRRIITSSERLDKMITDILSFSRISVEPLARKTIDLEKLVRRTIEQDTKLQSPRADFRLESPLSNVVGHEPSLTQCISNLMSNAVKFVAPGVMPRVKIWTEPVDQNVRIWIEDNGIGIAADDQKRIFNAFERLDQTYEGTGFGLAIVRKAVERMGGKFGVQSQPGKGSQFWIQLPTNEPVEMLRVGLIDTTPDDSETSRKMGSRFTFKRIPLSLNLVKRRGADPTVHIAGFKDVPVCLTSKGTATAREAPSYERVDGVLDCPACEQWAKSFEESWIKAGDVRSRKTPPTGL